MAPYEESSSLVCSARALLGSAYASATGCAQQWAQAQAESLSRPLPRPPSLVFDLELEDTVKHGHGSEEEQVGTSQLKRWLMPGSTGEFKLRNDVEQGLAQCEGPVVQSALDANQTLATFLTRLGYYVHIRTALGGGDGFECLRNLRHVFLAVNPPGAAATTNRFVVDLSFKEQFRIAKPTPRYSSLLACLPEVFVAPEAAVAPLVNFLCQEMAFAFRAIGVVLPPWRQTNSMLSKWLPRKSLDEQVPRGIPSASGMPNNQAVGGLTPRRSMDPASAAPQVYGHWMHPQAGHQLQQKAAAAPAINMQQQAAQQRRLQQGEGVEAVGPSRRFSLVKPMVCEPKLKLVGGNFSSVGFS